MSEVTTITASDLKSRASKCIAYAFIRDVTVTINGNDSAMLISIARYEDLIKKAGESENE